MADATPNVTVSFVIRSRPARAAFKYAIPAFKCRDPRVHAGDLAVQVGEPAVHVAAIRVFK